jgi:hypothetical protein
MRAKRFLFFCIFVACVIGLFATKIVFTNARVSFFYPTSCLGGWQNPIHATGAPEVSEGGTYTKENSAVVSDTLAQIFCGAFSGELPADALPKKVKVRFSWSQGISLPVTEILPDVFATSSENVIKMTEEENPVLVIPIERQSEPEPLQEVLQEGPVDTSPQEQASPDTNSQEVETPTTPEVPAQEGSAPQSRGSQFISNLFFTVAHAQESQEEVPQESIADVVQEVEIETKLEEKLATTSEEILESLIEVLYTLDGTQWRTLGYIDSISNDIEFELPTDIFTSVEDLQKVQIALHVLSTTGAREPIFLDSLWLEVRYDTLPSDALMPPHVSQGDTILSEVLSGTLRAVFTQRRNGEKELWVHEVDSDGWVRVADASLLSSAPALQFVDRSIFWVGYGEKTIWRFNTISGAYESLSINLGETSALHFRDDATEDKFMLFDPMRNALELYTPPPIVNE